jgi:hypothetical protein
LVQLCEFSKSQEWKLLYRASRDGFSATNFRSKCNEIEKTLTVITSESGNVFGGYTDKAWTSGNAEYITDPNAFIFSLINKENKPFKVICSDGGIDAIMCNSSYGPTFGICPSDIFIADNSNTNSCLCNFGNKYKHPDFIFRSEKAKNILAGSYDFKTIEIEVYTKDN